MTTQPPCVERTDTHNIFTLIERGKKEVKESLRFQKMSLDIEQKLFLILCAFSILKASGIMGSEWLVLVLRTCFVLVHALFAVLYYRTNKALTDARIGGDVKMKGKEALKQTFKSVFIRSLVVITIHVKTGMWPPLLVSSILGVFVVMENSHVKEQIMPGR